MPQLDWHCCQLGRGAPLSNFPASGSYKEKIDYLDNKAERCIVRAEKEALANTKRQAEEALAAAHQWQSTVTTPKFKDKLAGAVPKHNSVRLFQLEEAIDKMQLGVPFHWVCNSRHVLQPC